MDDPHQRRPIDIPLSDPWDTQRIPLCTVLGEMMFMIFLLARNATEDSVQFVLPGLLWDSAAAGHAIHRSRGVLGTASSSKRRRLWETFCGAGLSCLRCVVTPTEFFGRQRLSRIYRLFGPDIGLFWATFTHW